MERGFAASYDGRSQLNCGVRATQEVRVSLLSVIRRLFVGERANPFGLRGVHYEGGDGSTRESAIIVRGAVSELEGIAATFGWMHEHLGAKDEEWRLVTHSSGSDGGRKIDTFHVVLRRGETRHIYFDVSESFGKRFGPG